MKSFARILFLVAVALGMTGQAFSHEFLIKPEHWNTYQAGQELPLSVYSTHIFMKGEEIEDPKKVELFYAGQKVELTPNQALMTQDGRITLKGGEAALIEGVRHPILWSETPQGGVEGGRHAHPDATRVASYEKYTRLLLPVDGHTQAFDQVSGHKLEIIPLTNPLTAKVGDELHFRVLLNGRPAAFESIEATYDGFTDIPSAWAYTAAPFQHGLGVVKISASGLWIVKVDLTLPHKTDDYDEEQLRATLIFPVK